MPTEEMSKDIMNVLAKHGVAGLPKEAVRSPAPTNPVGPAASYIKEIITDGQVFDEELLDRVVNVLRRR